MCFAIHHPNGTIISHDEYLQIKQSAEILITRISQLIIADPCTDSSTRAQTKTFIKDHFKEAFNKAILKLEAEHKLLHLCLAHWKADKVLGQGFMRQKDAEARSTAKNHAHATHVPMSNPTGT